MLGFSIISLECVPAFVCSGYECPTGTHGFYDAPADYKEYLGIIGIDSRKLFLLISSVSWPGICRFRSACTRVP